jgi:hypothetical protein
MDALQQGDLNLAAPLYALKIAGSQGADRKVNFLIFAGNQSSPACVAKTLRTPSIAPRLQAEYATQARLFAQMGASVPQPLALLDIEGQTVMVERAIGGQALSVLMKQDAKHRKPAQIYSDLHRVLDWLAEFQHKTMGTAPGQMNITGAEGIDLPLVGCHGDFWAGNIFLQDNQLAVIDWEDYREGVLPTHDAFLFITTYALSYWQKTSKDKAFRQSFLTDNWFAHLLDKVIREYFTALNLAPTLIAPLFLHFLTEMATGADHSQARKGLQPRWQDYLKWYQAEINRSIWATH